jgi:catechol 2,3-dioxygenase
MVKQTLPMGTRMGAVALGVPSLQHSLAFYEGILGLTPNESAEGRVDLSSGSFGLVTLLHEPASQRAPTGVTGLYHMALRLPNRLALAQVLRRLMARDYPLQGAADHGVSEALYLSDPDGFGLELYIDRAEADWPREGGRLQMGTERLDLPALFESGQGEGDGLARGTQMGHVHLHVRDLLEAERFYCGVIGFEVMQRYGSSASFVSAGGYHHHVGLNTWAGEGAPPPPAGSAGLRWLTVLVPDPDTRRDVAKRLQASGGLARIDEALLETQDPSGNPVRVEVLPTANA